MDALGPEKGFNVDIRESLQGEPAKQLFPDQVCRYRFPAAREPGADFAKRVEYGLVDSVLESVVSQALRGVVEEKVPAAREELAHRAQQRCFSAEDFFGPRVWRLCSAG